MSGRLDIARLRDSLLPTSPGTDSRTYKELIRAERDRLADAIETSGLAPGLLDECAPGIRLRTSPPGDEVAVGASRLGGRPDLPAASGWPHLNGQPMAFLAQFDCAALRHAFPFAAIPESGLLTLFAILDPDSGDADDARLLVLEPHGLTPAAWPPELPDELRYATARVTPEPALFAPDWPDLETHSPGDSVDTFLEATTDTGPQHRLFGHPSSIQGTEAPDDHTFLLQLDEDPISGTRFGDGGRLHLWLPAHTQLETGTTHPCIIELDCY